MREIPTGDPEDLSLEDRLYLQDRGQLPKGAKPVTTEEYWSLVTPADPVNTGDVGTTTEGHGKPDGGGPPQPPEPESEVEYEDDYDKWTKAELQEELLKRELEASGNKADLIARMRGYDAGEED